MWKMDENLICINCGKTKNEHKTPLGVCPNVLASEVEDMFSDKYYFLSKDGSKITSTADAQKTTTKRHAVVERPKRKVLQIMDAENWVVKYEEDDGSDLGYCNMMGFALVEETYDSIPDEKNQNVVGFDLDEGYMEYVDSASNFGGYARRSDIDVSKLHQYV